LNAGVDGVVDEPDGKKTIYQVFFIFFKNIFNFHFFYICLKLFF